jgi:iron complex transport system permease protein
MYMTTTLAAPAPVRALPRVPQRRLLVALAVAVGLVLVAIALSLAIGARDISLATVWHALFAFDPSSAEQQLVREGRVTRTVIGLVAGAALALAGALAQSVTRNPLADPGLLGLNAGAALAVVLGLTVFSVTTFTGQLWLAFAGAGLAALAVLAIGGRGVSSPIRLALAGAAITAALTAVTSGILLAQPFALSQFRFWLAGSLTGRADAPLAPVLGIGVLALVLTWLSVRPLSALALGDDAAASLGVRAWRTRTVVMIAVALLAGLATALAGPIVFVGLAVPHLVRAVAGPRLGWLFILSIPAGAALVLLCDVLGRVLARPGELPVGVTTALFGGAMLALMARRLKVVNL